MERATLARRTDQPSDERAVFMFKLREFGGDFTSSKTNLVKPIHNSSVGGVCCTQAQRTPLETYLGLRPANHRPQLPAKDQPSNARKRAYVLGSNPPMWNFSHLGGNEPVCLPIHQLRGG